MGVRLAGRCGYLPGLHRIILHNITILSLPSYIMIQEVKQIQTFRGALRTRFAPGKLIGYAILLSYFTLLPAALKLVWPWLLTLDRTLMYVGSVLVLNVGLFALYCFLLYLIHHTNAPFFQQFKNTSKPWPWEGNPQEWNRLFRKSLLFISINFFIVTPVMVWISLRTSLPYEFSLQLWPSFTELTLQFIFFMLVEDTLFYWSHRILHRPSFYWIHKHHHEYHQTIGFASQYVHPIEYILSGTIPSSLGFQILSYVCQVHYATILVWLIYRFIQSYESHSGFTWSWNTLSLIPYTVGSDHHDFHHAMNCGNYGSVFLFWDAYCETEKPFVDFLQKQAKEKAKGS